MLVINFFQLLFEWFLLLIAFNCNYLSKLKIILKHIYYIVCKIVYFPVFFVLIISYFLKKCNCFFILLEVQEILVKVQNKKIIFINFILGLIRWRFSIVVVWVFLIFIIIVFITVLICFSIGLEMSFLFY